jgi:hypothetical protein
MRKYHSHTLLYLHETIALGSGSSDRFIEEFSGTYQPMMHELGARLFALWETAPYNGHWPQVTIIWEIDAFADYARIGSAQSTRRQPRVRRRQEMVRISRRYRSVGGGSDHVSGAE